MKIHKILGPRDEDTTRGMELKVVQQHSMFLTKVVSTLDRWNSRTSVASHLHRSCLPALCLLLNLILVDSHDYTDSYSYLGERYHYDIIVDRISFLCHRLIDWVEFNIP